MSTGPDMLAFSDALFHGRLLSAGKDRLFGLRFSPLPDMGSPAAQSSDNLYGAATLR